MRVQRQPDRSSRPPSERHLFGYKRSTATRPVSQACQFIRRVANSHTVQVACADQGGALGQLIRRWIAFSWRKGSAECRVWAGAICLHGMMRRHNDLRVTEVHSTSKTSEVVASHFFEPKKKGHECKHERQEEWKRRSSKPVSSSSSWWRRWGVLKCPIAWSNVELVHAWSRDSSAARSISPRGTYRSALFIRNTVPECACLTHGTTLEAMALKPSSLEQHVL